MGDEGFDQIPGRFFEGLRAAEVGGIGLNKRGVEIVLADQEAELVTQAWLSIIRPIGMMETF